MPVRIPRGVAAQTDRLLAARNDAMVCACRIRCARQRGGTSCAGRTACWHAPHSLRRREPSERGLLLQDTGWQFSQHTPHDASQVIKQGSDMLVLRRFTLHCCLFVIASMALLTVSGVAQDSSAEKKERDVQRRIGIYLSGQGLADGVDAIGIGSIDFPSEDIMPYPFFFISTRYNKYQVTLAFGNDKYGRNEYNESIMRFTARYNYYPFKKILYVSGGPDLWYFNKKFSFTRDVCIGNYIVKYPSPVTSWAWFSEDRLPQRCAGTLPLDY